MHRIAVRWASLGANYDPCPRTASAATRDLVGGAVVMWGRVELHGTGLRAVAREHGAPLDPSLRPPRLREPVVTSWRWSPVS